MNEQHNNTNIKPFLKGQHSFWIYLALLALLVITPYVLKFHSSNFSANTQDWGAFGSYVSGVIGTIILTLTLYNLVQTKNQQNIMIKAQSNQILLQEQQNTISEIFYTTEMALKNYPILHESMMKNHIKNNLSTIFMTAQKDDINSTIAQSNTKDGITFQSIIRRYNLDGSPKRNFITWLTDDDIDQEIRSCSILALMDPLLSHLDLILKLSPISPYINDFIKNESINLRSYFICAYHFYSSYRDHTSNDLLLKKYSNIDQLDSYMKNLLPSIDCKTSEDEFWSKLGKILAKHEESTVISLNN